MKVALVTGGSRGIGAAIVEALHAAGDAVYFTYAREADAARRVQRRLGAERAVCAPCDVADGKMLPALVDACLTRFGRLDVLINNAGIYAENAFDADSYEAWRTNWQRTFAVNLFGAADLAFLAMRAMRENPPDRRGTRGRIVNVTSRSAHRGELSFADYAASKAALRNLVKSIARSCARDGIVAFDVAPGYIATDMAAEAIAAEGDHIRGEIPGGRIGTPEEVAGIVTFLASGDADYATGTTIDVNGASYVR
jgi:3-oxoacyl-[acyl-carrier protein] reductase